MSLAQQSQAVMNIKCGQCRHKPHPPDGIRRDSRDQLRDVAPSDLAVAPHDG